MKQSGFLAAYVPEDICGLGLVSLQDYACGPAPSCSRGARWRRMSTWANSRWGSLRVTTGDRTTMGR